MTRLAVAIVLAACSREPATVSGIPAGAHLTCDFPENGGTRVFCVADQVAYFCVSERTAEPKHWECAPVRALSELERP